MKKHNFSPGPAILPASVLEQAADAVRNFDNSGLSILEISHRSPGFSKVMAEAESLVRELLHVGEDYGVIFITGGASGEFFLTAMNLLNEDDKAGYLDTGAWSAKAIKEANLFGKVEVLASSKDKNYNYIPKSYEIPADLKYVHLTSNNTIFGTQIENFPDTEVPLVADMSSDIFSRRLPLEKFGIIYAGAQKNMGPAGVTLVIIKKDLLGKVKRDLPSMLDYRTHIEKGSTFNTPPVYPIYVSMLTMRWVKEQGGLEAMEKHNEAKAKILYDEIERNPKFECTIPAVGDRSLMNVTFKPVDDADLEPFIKAAAAVGVEGIKGHRSVGGFRASIYNAMPIESVQVLVDVMKSF